MEHKEIDILKKRIAEDSINSIDGSRAMGYCSLMNPDGSWSDVDYSSQAWANWPLRVHFGRIKAMSCAYADKKSGYYQSRALQEAVCLGTDFWMRREWPNPNWWNTEMLPQQEMRYPALLMGEALGAERTEFIIGILQDSVEEKWTGANRVWFAENVMFKGILTGNETLVCHASERILSTAVRGWDELSAPEDGLQPDASFMQHGRLLYNNGYGAAWLDSISFWIYQMRGLSFGADRTEYETAIFALLDGTAWMQHKGIIDPGTCGREISRKRAGFDVRIGRAAHRLYETARIENFPRADELLSFEQYLKGENASPKKGNKMFWRADYMVHRQQEFTASVKLISHRVKGSESILNENKLGGFLSYGMTVFMRHGREYFGSGREDGIFSVMDWTHMPGVTAPVIEVSAADTNGIDTAFAGGVTDGQNGAAAMAYEKSIGGPKETVCFGGRKAYFFFDEGAAVLGAGLHCDSAALELDTTVNQTRFAGISYSEGRADQAVKVRRRGSWVNHDLTGYVFFEPTEYELEQGEFTGAWERITDSYPAEQKKRTKQAVFKLTIRHGVHVRDKACAYAVLPGQSVRDTQQAAAEPPVRVIANCSLLQAVYVRKQKITYLIFYEAGKCSVYEGFSVAADGRCMLMIKETEGTVRVYASNPETPGLRLHILVEYKGIRIDRTAVFPKGESLLGKTIEII